MNYLVYVAHGAEHFRLEAVYSILSFLQHGRPPGDDCAVLVVTDAPGAFRRLGDAADVRYLPVDAAQLRAWRGGADGYVHRIKPQAILYAVRSVDADADDAFLFVDSDTSFLRGTGKLFDGIHRGDAVFLHAREGTIAGNRRHSRSQGRLYAATRQHGFTVCGVRGLLPPDLPLWNSGAIGFRGDRAWLFEETLALTDEIVATVPIAAAEQVALSAVLAQRRIPVQAAEPWLLHYHVFKEFRADLAAFFARYPNLEAEGLGARIGEIDPQLRIQPKLAFNRLPKWWRQLRKAVRRPWRPLPYPWTGDAMPPHRP